MSKLITPRISPKNKKIDWINHLVSTHNLICGCEQPLTHTIEEILDQEPNLPFACPSCRGTGTAVATTKEDDGFGDGDLEALFAGDFGDAEKEASTSAG